MQSNVNTAIISNLTELTSEIYKSDTSVRSKEEMTAVQNRVAIIWSKILGFDDFGVDDDLFRVGGDSIAAVQIFSALNDEFGIDLSMQELFSSSCFSIRWLADLIKRHQISAIGEEEYSALLERIEGLSEDEINEMLSQSDR